ncbi:hypothetical protein SDC9_184924 [bioreactor metagenome]|uniref:Uncharacterized protein n=2 Tax=root TaxID=1 RepID=A0A645HEE4_9ZZZZ
MVPLIINGEPVFTKDQYVFIPDLRDSILKGKKEIKAYAIGDDRIIEFNVSVGDMTDDEKKIIAAGCLINYYKTKN